MSAEWFQHELNKYPVVRSKSWKGIPKQMLEQNQNARNSESISADPSLPSQKASSSTQLVIN